ncbi:helix-turn-helix domain-containing protein [Microbacterium timonense]|uniref:helix-turn-helix domain-containing protein n=1 Tax=Microbacterium timonense TaxID=2086576 RepID=UPI000D109B1B|nr:AraC family transcriptional regulator [Microbacterium timonense]
MDLAETPANDREEYLDFLTTNCAVPFRSRTAHTEQPMTFVHMHREIGSMTVFENTYSNYSGVRPLGIARSSDEKMITIGMPMGPMGFAQGDSQVQGAARSMVAFWGLAPYGAEVRQEIYYSALVAPIEDLGLPTVLVRNITGIELGSSPLATVFASHVRTLLALPEMTLEEEAALAGPTLELLRALLVTAAGDEFEAREPLNRTLMLRAMSFLEANFASPELSVAQLATHLGVSRTRAYALLSEAGIGFTEWLRERRLERAVQMLESPSSGLMSIGEIARQVGFRDHATFTRAFRAQYGSAPTEWRARVRGNVDELPLTTAASVSSDSSI